MHFSQIFLAHCLAWVCLILHVSVLFMKILFVFCPRIKQREYRVVKENIYKTLLLLLLLRFSKDLNDIKVICFITLNVFKNNCSLFVFFLLNSNQAKNYI